MATQRKEVVTAPLVRGGQTVSSVAKTLGLSDQTLHNWLKRRSYTISLGGRFSGARSGKCTLITGLHLYWQISSGLA